MSSQEAKKWRRLYTFACDHCGNKRASTFSYRAFLGKRCKKCRALSVKEAADSVMFPSVQAPAEDGNAPVPVV